MTWSMKMGACAATATEQREGPWVVSYPCVKLRCGDAFPQPQLLGGWQVDQKFKTSQVWGVNL